MLKGYPLSPCVFPLSGLTYRASILPGEGRQGASELRLGRLLLRKPVLKGQVRKDDSHAAPEKREDSRREELNISL